MTQQSHCWAYIQRKPKFKKNTCSPGHGTHARTWKQPKCPSTEEWIKKLWYIYTIKYYSAIKRNEIQLFVMRWMDLESVLQSEVSQKEKIKYRMLTHICGIQKNGTDELVCKAKIETQMQRTYIWIPRGQTGRDGGDAGGMNWEIGIEIYTLICIKWLTNKNLLY